MWQKVSFTVCSEQAELLGDQLLEAGALAIDFVAANAEEIFEPAPQTMPLWSKTIVTGLFSAEVNPTELLTQLTSLIPFSLPTPTFSYLADKDWVHETQRQFQPMQFSDKVWICPSWCTPPDSTATTVLMEPGLAFGTGTHPTTALCLTWLATHPPRNQRVIDYGCGSGILGITAAKLGARQVWATDIDAQALQACQANAKLNHLLTNQIRITSVDNPPNWQADLLMANILAQPLIELAPTFTALLQSKGWLLLSGLLNEQMPMVLNAYKQSFQLASCQNQEQWLCLTMQKL